MEAQLKLRRGHQEPRVLRGQAGPQAEAMKVEVRVDNFAYPIDVSERSSQGFCFLFFRSLPLTFFEK